MDEKKLYDKLIVERFRLLYAYIAKLEAKIKLYENKVDNNG